MTITSKIDILKAGINYDNNPFVRETLSMPFDFYRAVEDAIRQIGSGTRIMQKIVYVPVVQDVTFNTFTLSNLCSEKIEIVKPLKVGLVGLNDSGDVIVGKLGEALLEKIVSNEITELYRVALRYIGEKTYVQSTILAGDVPQGIYETITQVGTSLIHIAVESNASAGKYILNLSKSDSLRYSYKKVTGVVAGDIFLDSDPTGDWIVGDKLYISNGTPQVVSILFQSIPQYGYFDTETVIPVPAQIINDIDHLAYPYLYNILGSRDPKQIEVYGAKIKSGLIRSPQSALRLIRTKVNFSSEVTEVERYNPFETKYGR